MGSAWLARPPLLVTMSRGRTIAILSRIIGKSDEDADHFLLVSSFEVREDGSCSTAQYLPPLSLKQLLKVSPEKAPLSNRQLVETIRRIPLLAEDFDGDGLIEIVLPSLIDDFYTQPVGYIDSDSNLRSHRA